MLKRGWEILATVCVLAATSVVARAQQVAIATVTASSASAAVPRLIKFSGALLDEQGRATKGPVGVTFALYAQQSGGAALWMETQDIKPDASGNYTVLLGATSVNGIPEELFASGQARWLGVQAEGQTEQPRVLLVSVPYALKAGDAQTLGGLPASAFLTASSQNGKAPAPVSPLVVTTALGAQPSSIMAAPTGSGSANTIPLWTSSTNLGNSNITQVGNIVSVKDSLQLPATGTATSTLGFNSQPFDLLASSFNSTLATAINQHFRWQAEPVGNNSVSPSGKLNLLYAPGAATPTETGLSISNKGLINFVPGQTYPGVSVGLSAPSADFKVSGSPVNKSGTLALAWNVPPTSADTKNAIVKRDSTGRFSAGGITATALGNVIVATMTGNTAQTAAVTGTATASGIGNTYGVAGYSSTGNGVGLFGQNKGNGFGVFALAGGASPAIWGENTNTSGGISDGVHGVAHSSGSSGVAGVNNSGGIGVFGTGGTGVFGTADEGNALGGTNNSTVFSTLNVGNNTTGLSTAPVFETFGPAFSGFCKIDVSGDLGCTGVKSAVVPVDSGTRKVALYAVEAPENWFEDFGSGTLAGGTATIALEPTFAQTVNASVEYHVFLTAKGDCKGLYVTNETPRSFEVRELKGGHSNIAFDYRIIAKRKGYEKVRLEDKTAMMKAAQANAARFSSEPVPAGKLSAPATKSDEPQSPRSRMNADKQ